MIAPLIRYAVTTDLSSAIEVDRETHPSAIVAAGQIPVQALSSEDAIAGARWYRDDYEISVRTLADEDFVSHWWLDEPWSVASPLRCRAPW